MLKFNYSSHTIIAYRTLHFFSLLFFQAPPLTKTTATMVLVALLILVAVISPASPSTLPPSYYYSQCAPAVCGSSVLRWPFGLSPLCRRAFITVTCTDNSTVLITDEVSPQTRYRLLEPLNSTTYARRALRISDSSLSGCGPIPPYLSEIPDKWLAAGGFSMSPGYVRETFFNCTAPPVGGVASQLRKAPCLDCVGAPAYNKTLCYFYDGYSDQVGGCIVSRVNIPPAVYANLNSDAADLRKDLAEQGISVQWDGACGEDCVNTGGHCGYTQVEATMGTELCFCPNEAHQHNCSDGVIVSLGGRGHGHGSTKIIAGVLAVVLVIALAAGVYLFIQRNKKTRQRMIQRGLDEETLRRYLDAAPPSIETFLENYASGMPLRFEFKQLKKYSNNLAHKLGQGGFGSVYKATLPNGSSVAVKILDETEQSEIQFLNEVQTVGRIHHDHLVQLLGYCFEHHHSKHSRRALVYEFMEKGSLEKYIHRKSQAPPERLSCSQLHGIALGTAKGIAYLHEECRDRILHCDIKPHNILLDAQFRPKVSDFGLAQMMNRDNSHVSLDAGRGTPGYAPPEMWWRSYGPITEKSDVYSFGMVVLEMVGGRKNFEGDASRTSQLYFPEWIYEHQGLMVGAADDREYSEDVEEQRVMRRMALVGLWCIQYAPSRRPSMRKVIEMLEGDAEIDVPPAPQLISAARNL